MSRTVPIPLLVFLLMTGCGTPSLLITPVANTEKLEEINADPDAGWSATKIAIVELEGMLINARSGGFLQPSENKLSLFQQEMNRAARDPAVKAVVLRINSPGGTVTCSDNMYEIVKAFRASTKKPVIASAQEVCASGGYYIACGADRIVANPTSVVGSVGVIMTTLDLSGVMGKVGIRAESITSGPLKDMGSPFKPLANDARAVMQGMIDDYYSRFVGVVKQNRVDLTNPGDINQATDGRVFSGEQAYKLKLVDQLGTLDDALALARQMSKSPDARAVLYRRPFGYGGSIYASQPGPVPQTNVLRLELPESELFAPRGFYYMWQP